MADTVSKEQRSLNMSLIRSTDTKPEVFVRSVLHRMGFRFRKNVKSLPGKPDIVLPKYKTAIFVHGCFWHQHKGCKRSTVPKSNVEYWKPKLIRNTERDSNHTLAMEATGWSVFVIWECQTKNADTLISKLKSILTTNNLAQQ